MLIDLKYTLYKLIVFKIYYGIGFFPDLHIQDFQDV